MSLNYIVQDRENYLVKCNGTRTCPWRTIVISANDKDLLDNDMAQKLASPSRIQDISWIKPGKVAWDWWNDWNIKGVDFKAGINTNTYKYYIDFASENKIEYVVLDEGWSNDTNLLAINKEMDIEEIVSYAKAKNVGIFLWATWYAVQKDLTNTFEKYSKMGIKGFKIDFIDRDDAKINASLFHIANEAAKHQLLLDYHGMFKPSGMNRTYPNILNFEGVKGLENYKWSDYKNVPEYDVIVPFIRMISGPMDYTPGAMRSATQSSYFINYSNPMSQGTRCHQQAMYVIYEAPLQMLADNPSAYKSEQECTDFIAQIPTAFDKTIAIDAKIGEYALLARQKDSIWYLGAMTDWQERDLSIDFSFLGDGNFELTLFQDGYNASKEATDYKKIITTIDKNSKINIHLANGGGWAAMIKPAN